jgi:hypothetical protein
VEGPPLRGYQIQTADEYGERFRRQGVLAAGGRPEACGLVDAGADEPDICLGGGVYQGSQRRLQVGYCCAMLKQVLITTEVGCVS